MSSQGLPYGSAITEHFRRPRNYGTLPNATVSAECVNALCGDRVRVAVLIDSAGDIAEARFTANACAICVAAASLLTERLRGLSSAAAGRLGESDVAALVGGAVPAARQRCATLPLQALHQALASIGDDLRRQPSA